MKAVSPVTESKTYKISCQWYTSLKDSFNTLLVDKVFRSSRAVLVIGHEDGVVRTYEIPDNKSTCDKAAVTLKAGVCIETKGGPIQTAASHAVCRLGGREVIAADSRGLVTLLGEEQIFTRKSVSQHAVQFVAVDEDSLGNIAIVTGDSEGNVSAFTLYDDLWKLRLSDILYSERLSNHMHIGHLLAVKLTNVGGHKTNYVLVTDNNGMLYFVQQGTIVLALKTPEIITAMCEGRFLDLEQTDEGRDASTQLAHSTQVALGSDTGAIYILSNYQIYAEKFANIETPINMLHCIACSEPRGVDSVLCAGDSDRICIVREGKEMASYTLPSWVNSVAACPSQLMTDGCDIVVGCVNRTVHGLRVNVC